MDGTSIYNRIESVEPGVIAIDGHDGSLLTVAGHLIRGDRRGNGGECDPHRADHGPSGA